MAVVANRLTVGTTATRVDALTDGLYDLSTVMIRCPTATVFVGGPGVTTATGFQVVANEALEWELRSSVPLGMTIRKRLGSVLTRRLRGVCVRTARRSW